MVVLNESTNESLDNITILLEKCEAIQMIGYLEELLSNTTDGEHYHLNNETFSKEITIALYDKKGNLGNFAEKYKKLILSDN